MKPTNLLNRLGCLGLAAILGITATAHAQETDLLTGQSLYGIDGTTGQLSRYDFTDKTSELVGTVHFKGSSTPLTGIEASAYIPRTSNIMAFWTDPADGQTKMIYINLDTAEATVLANDLGSGTITGAVATTEVARAQLDVFQKTSENTVREHAIYAIQNPPSFDFDIDNNVVKPQQDFVAKVTVLGAAIKSGSNDVPVSMKVTIGNTVYEPFGSYHSSSNGNVNDSNNPRRHVFSETHRANTAITISAQSWISGDSYIDTTSNASSQQVKVLRNGDNVPNIQGFEGQSNILHFVNDYIDTTTDKIRLADNQVIYLFELGTTNLSSSAADFQDLVVLITLTDEVNDQSMVSDASDKTRLVKVNHKTGLTETVMELSREYDSLAASTADAFLATSGTGVYLINPAAGTETLISSVVGSRNAMEVSGDVLYGFDDGVDLLDAVYDLAADAAAAEDYNLGLQDLRTIVFVRHPDVPVYIAAD